MKTTKERKIFTGLLIFYWLGIFITTHIPVPGWTRNMGVSDKTMHFFAYMILSLLLWLGTSFEQKADWKKLRPWLLSAIILLYGAADELSQHFTSRSADIMDFEANALGVAAAMAIVTILPACHTVMILATTCPIFGPAIVRSQLITGGSIYEAAAYIAGMAIITTMWLKYLSSVFGLNIEKNKLLPAFFVPPAGTVIIVKFYALLTDKPFGTTAMLSAFASITLTIFVWRLISRKKNAI